MSASIGMAVVASAERRIGAVVEEPLRRDLGESAERGEVGVVAGGLAGQRDVQRVVEVVAPLRGQAEAARLARRDQLGSLRSDSAIRRQRTPDGGQASAPRPAPAAGAFATGRRGRARHPGAARRRGSRRIHICALSRMYRRTSWGRRG